MKKCCTSRYQAGIGNNREVYKVIRIGNGHFQPEALYEKQVSVLDKGTMQSEKF